MPNRELQMPPMKNDPAVRLQARKGSTFRGRFLGSKAIVINKAPSQLHEFEVLGGDAIVTLKTGSGDPVEVDVNVGDKVNIFGSKVIDGKLSFAEVGQIIEFTYLGKKGRMNDYKIEVVE